MTAFEYSGGSLCLDLANTWGNRSDPASDRLENYRDLLDWALGAGLIGGRERSELEKLAHREADTSQRVFRNALELRDTVFHVCSATAAGRLPSERQVAALNAALQTVPRQQLCCGGECCQWEWPALELDLRQVVWPVIQSAADLVTSPDAARIRECGAPDCNWLFLDRSRNRGRRWCSMDACGNRVKMARRYVRSKKSKTSSPSA